MAIGPEYRHLDDGRIITEKQYQDEVRWAKTEADAEKYAKKGWFISIPAGVIAWLMVFFLMDSTTGWFWRGLAATIVGMIVYQWINYLLVVGVALTGCYFIYKLMDSFGAF